MKLFSILIISCYGFVGFCQTVLVDHNSENSDDLWSMGAADVMSFYLQEQGLKVIFREELNSMLGEVALADAKISNSSLNKGKWNGFNHILTGSINEVNNGLSLKLSLSEMKNASVLVQYEHVFSDQNKLAIELESQARNFARVIAAEFAQLPKVQKSVNPAFQGLSAQALFNYYRAVELILSDKAPQGAEIMYQLLDQEPGFDPPYFWLASFFDKHGLKLLANSLRVQVKKQSYKNNSQRLFIKTEGMIQSDDFKHITSLLKRQNFNVVEPRSLIVHDTENDLIKWGYVSGMRSLEKMDMYSCSYIFKIKELKNKKYQFTLIDSVTGESLRTLIVNDIKSLSHDFENDLNNKIVAIKSKNQSSNSQKEILSHSDMTFQDGQAFYQALFKYIEKYDNIRNLLVRWRMIYLRTHYHVSNLEINSLRKHRTQLACIESLWDEIILRSSSKEKLYLTIEKLKDLSHLEFRISGTYHLLHFIKFKKRVAHFVDDCTELASTHKDPILNWCNAFNKAALLIDEDNTQALESFVELKVFLDHNPSLLTSINEGDYKRVIRNLDYWIWYCAKDTKHSMEGKYKALVEKHMSENVYSLNQFIYPGYSTSTQSLTIRFGSVYMAHGTKEANGKIWYTRSSKYKIIQNQDVLTLPRDPDEHTWQIALEILNEMTSYDVKNDLPLEKQQLFEKALSFLEKSPENKLSPKLRKRCINYALQLNNRNTERVLTILGEYESAVEYIRNLNRDSSGLHQLLHNHSQQIHASQKHFDLSTQMYLQEVVPLQTPFSVYRLLKETIYSNNTDLSYKLIKSLKKQKLSESQKIEIMYWEAKYFFMNANFLEASNLLKKAAKLCSGKTYKFEKSHLGNLNDMIHHLIKKIDNLPRNNYRPSSWPITYYHRYYTLHYSGPPEDAMKILPREIKLNYEQLLNSVYYKGQHHIPNQAIQKFCRSSDPKAIISGMNKVLNNNPAWRDMWLIKKLNLALATKENEELIFDYFSKDWRYIDAAFKVNRKRAYSILKSKVWIFDQKNIPVSFRKYVDNIEMQNKIGDITNSFADFSKYKISSKQIVASKIVTKEFDFSEEGKSSDETKLPGTLLKIECFYNGKLKCLSCTLGGETIENYLYPVPKLIDEFKLTQGMVLKKKYRVRVNRDLVFPIKKKWGFLMMEPSNPNKIYHVQFEYLEKKKMKFSYRLFELVH